MPTETAMWRNETKDDYLTWLDAQIAKKTATYKKFRRTSPCRVPISTARLPHYKELLVEVFGAGCHLCGYEGEKMVLAHKYYAPDSVPSDEGDGRGHLHRVCEALEYPERFVRLCQLCHDIFDHSRRAGGYSFLLRVARLIRHSKELEKIECP
jgi:hypothetical protein